MPKFEERYLYRLWNEELLGKRVFYSDSIPKLKEYVEANDKRFIGTVVGTNNATYPFYIKDKENYMFVYFDPYLELKIAYEKGYRILYLHASNIWVIIENQLWSYPPERYRIKQDFMEYRRFATGRQIAEWLARGMGEICFYKDEILSNIKLSYYNYENDDEPATEVLVRTWEDIDWSKPTLKYLGFEGYDIM